MAIIKNNTNNSAITVMGTIYGKIVFLSVMQCYGHWPCLGPCQAYAARWLSHVIAQIMAITVFLLFCTNMSNTSCLASFTGIMSITNFINFTKLWQYHGFIAKMQPILIHEFGVKSH